jgi:tRNA-specific 2-thiouridylase
MTKSAVYEFVEEHGFKEFRGQESQDVCFLGDHSIGHFLEARTQTVSPGGDIVDLEGKILGQHNGVSNYTIGQRRGLGISNATPLYVIRIDAEKNALIVGQEDDLQSDALTASDASFILSEPPRDGMHVDVKIRYRSPAVAGTFHALSCDRFSIDFDVPQRAVTPGQIVALYDGEELLGGGVIDERGKIR